MFKTVSLGCRDLKLKLVQTLRQPVFIFLDSLTFGGVFLGEAP